LKSAAMPLMQDWRMRFTQSASILIVERLKEATKKKTEEDGMGETATQTLI
jgi:hypothetical protein